MPAKPTLAKFNALVEKFATTLKRHVKREVKEDWVQAFGDIRFPVIHDGSGIYKFRAKLADGTVFATLRITPELATLLDRMLEMKDLVFDPKWYGLKISVFPDGRFETEYNHDSKCYDDPTWFDT